jgi:hypothetical protein
MKFRLTLFFVFQIVAWTAYFNWETSTDKVDIAGKTEKVLQVEEMSTSQFASLETHKELQELILRNDGFFTRINKDQSVENGIWTVNYEIPSLNLKSPLGNKKYRILDDSDEYLQVELINAHELIQTKNTQETEPKLYSSIN